MVKVETDNVMVTRNAAITPRPSILFKTDSPDRAHAEFVRDFFGSKLMRVREFTAEYLFPGTAEHKAMEAGTTEDDRATLKAISLLRYAHGTGENSISRKALSDAAQILLPHHPGREAMVKPSLYASLLTREMARAKLVMRACQGRRVLARDLVSRPEVRRIVASAYRRISVCANCTKLFALDAERAEAPRSTARRRAGALPAEDVQTSCEIANQEETMSKETEGNYGEMQPAIDHPKASYKARKASAPTRGIFEKFVGSNTWWVRYVDAAGHYRREVAGSKSSARLLLDKRRGETLTRKKLPETLRQRMVPFTALPTALSHTSRNGTHVRLMMWRGSNS